MKNIIKIFGFAVVIAVIGFVSLSLTACPKDPKDDSKEEPFQPAPPRELKLVAHRYGEEDDYHGHDWASESLKLSDYTVIKPKRGDVLRFNIKGSADKELKNASITLSQKPGEIETFLADSKGQRLSNTFTGSFYVILAFVDGIDTRYDVYVQVVNGVWGAFPDGNIRYGSVDDKLPDDVLDGTTMATITNFTMTVEKLTAEDLKDEERWDYELSSATATMDHFSISNDGTVKFTVGGTPEDNGNAWKMKAIYAYTVKANTSYTYKFQARTESGTRLLPVNYYNGWEHDTQLGQDIDLTTSWQTFTIIGKPIPRDGTKYVEFHCANVIGTFYIKMISITETVNVSDGLQYTEENGKITITNYLGNGGAVTIPTSINGKPVTAIGDNAFQGCWNLTSVTIPNSVTTIGEFAFRDCENLISVTIPNSVTGIGPSAFLNTSLTNVNIPNSVTTIGEWVFNMCNSLTAITVNGGNNNYSSENGVLYNKAKTVLMRYPAGKTGASFTIPNTVTGIEKGAFSACTLTSITIPNSVEWIGWGAFRDSRLTSVTIPNSVDSINGSAFEFCTSLTSVTFAAGSNVTQFEENAFPEGNDGNGGDTLRTAYLNATTKAGTYTRAVNGSTWNKQ